MTTRRDLIAAATMGTAALAITTRQSEAQPRPKTFVLVHGGFGGGWVWRRVADLLEKRGHKVFTPTLTGVGERSHLLSAGVTLSTHVADIVNVIKWERLQDVVLVGHSYGGFVITGVAEQVRPAIASIVFLDAFVPENGQALADVGTLPSIPAAIEKREIAVAAPPAAVFNVNEADRAWVDAMSTPHPLATFTDKVRETGARERIGRKVYVAAVPPLAQLAGVHEKFRSRSGWRTYEVPSGHFVMIDMPERLTEILVEA